MKQSTSFYLSEECKYLLTALSVRLGTSKTSVIEMLIRKEVATDDAVLLLASAYREFAEVMRDTVHGALSQIQ